MRNSFLEKDIPYATLAKMGISKEKALSMPKQVLEPLMSGRATPLIEARLKLRNGNEISVPMKLQMIRDRQGNVRLMTYPVRKQMESDRSLSPAEQKQLEDGRILRKEKTMEDGTRRMQFLQLDKETKNIITRNAADLRISEQLARLESVKDIQLGQNQKDAIKEGKPVELTVGDQKVTVGLDNREPNGFKVVNGDMDEWKKQQMIRYDLVNEGYMGYVQTDKNRWEYKQVVDHLEHKDEQQNVRPKKQKDLITEMKETFIGESNEEKKDRKRSTGIKM